MHERRLHNRCRSQRPGRERTHAGTLARSIAEELLRCDIELVASLPDSWMGPLLREVKQEPRFVNIPVASEIEAVGIACGAYYGRKGACVIMANAGLMMCGYTLPTLALMHRIPVFMLVSMRGAIGDTAFYQEYQGLLTRPFLDAMSIPYLLIDRPEDIPRIGDVYRHSRVFRRPTVALLGKGALV